MKYKYRILEMLNDAPEDIKAMTVGELLEMCSKEVVEAKKDEDEANSKIIEEFTGVYIKVRETDSTFGLEVDYIRIDEIITGSKNTEWEQLFNIKGEKVQFSNICNALRELGGKCQTYMSYEELSGAEIITEKEYDKAKAQLEAINEITHKGNCSNTIHNID